MGFYDSLLDGTRSIGGWLGENVGNLQDAANAIASAAGDENSLPDDNNIYPKMFLDLNGAESNLYFYVQTVALPPTSSKTAETSHTSSSAFQPAPEGPFDMTGLWTNPGFVASGMMAPSNVNSDLRKFLTINNLPLVLTDHNGKPMDVAQEIGKQMFAAPKDQNPADGISFPTMIVKIDVPEYQIQGAHCYYSIPLGIDDSPDGAWHVYLRLYTMSTPTFEQQRAAKAKEFRLKSNGLTFPPGSFVNTTVVSATWTGLTWLNDDITAIMSNAANAMASITSGGEAVYQLQGPWMAAAGDLFIYTWVTALTVGSHDVLTTFTNEVNTAIQNVTGGGQPVPIGPAFEITFRQSSVVPTSMTR